MNFVFLIKKALYLESKFIIIIVCIYFTTYHKLYPENRQMGGGNMNGNKKIKIAIIILAVFLGLSILLLTGTILYDKLAPLRETSATVSDNIITPDSQDSETSKNETDNKDIFKPDNQNGDKGTALSLHKNNNDDSTPFAVRNMFPGDSESKNYYVKVSHKGDVTVKYRADIHNGGEKLSEVLKIKIAIPSQNKVIYDGVIKAMPTSLDVTVTTDKETESIIDYEITAYLETSVGNEYMNTELKADFKWWVEDTENLIPPQTGDSTNIILWLSIAVGSLLLIILLFRKLKKEGANNGR